MGMSAYIRLSLLCLSVLVSGSVAQVSDFNQHHLFMYHYENKPIQVY